MKKIKTFKLYESVESGSTTLSSALDNIQKDADAKKNQLIESLIDTIQEIFYEISDHEEMNSETKKVQRRNGLVSYLALDTKIEANLFTTNNENITERAFQSAIDCIKRVELAIKIKPSSIDFAFAKVREITNPSSQVFRIFSVEKSNELSTIEMKNKFLSAQESPDTTDAKDLVDAKKVFIWIKW